MVLISPIKSSFNWETFFLVHTQILRDLLVSMEMAAKLIKVTNLLHYPSETAGCKNVLLQTDISFIDIVLFRKKYVINYLWNWKTELSFCILKKILLEWFSLVWISGYVLCSCLPVILCGHNLRHKPYSPSLKSPTQR